MDKKELLKTDVLYVKAMRKALGFSTTDICKRLGITRQMIRSAETPLKSDTDKNNGIRKFYMSFIQAIVNALDEEERDIMYTMADMYYSHEDLSTKINDLFNNLEMKWE